jgi:cytochrome c oxidase subunit 4
MNETTTTQTAQEHGLAHVMPLKILGAVWIGLLIFTVVTVAATRIDLGSGNLWLALAIATTKATLVALYFMHLRYDRPFNAIVFMTAFAFFLLFVGLALMDTEAYRPDIIPGYAPAMQSP